MDIRHLGFLVLAVGALLATSAQAQFGLESSFGDAQRGEELARHFCSDCHGMEAAEPGRPLDSAPTFADLAGRNLLRQDIINTLTYQAVHVNPTPPARRAFLSSKDIDDLMAFMDTLDAPILE